MRAAKYLCLACGVAMLGAVSLANPVKASHFTIRQYYSGWYHYPRHNYYYRYYYYKPYPTYYGYKYHYTLYYPTRPKYYYYYNPYKKLFYGRCPVDHGGRPIYSWLKPEHQRPLLTQVDETNFPVPDGRTTPPIPESDPAKEIDGKPLQMDLPPGDPPTSALGLPVGN